MTKHTYKPGDLVRLVGDEYPAFGLNLGEVHPVGYTDDDGDVHIIGNDGNDFCFFKSEIEPADDTPKTWGKMTDAEKGALLLAAHEGKVIERSHDRGRSWSQKKNDLWHKNHAYRVRPDQKRETVKVVGFTHNNEWFFREKDARQTHAITFDMLDGKPDCSSVKMEQIGD